MLLRNAIPAAVAVLDAFVALTAIGGGIALATGREQKRFSTSMLAGTPFSTYLIPGLLLAGVVGGTSLVATVLSLRSPRAGAAASIVAGVSLMGWICGEVRILRAP
jgi:hypothetical protein